MDTKEKVQRDWKEIVEKSQGTLLFCPEALLPKLKEWNEKRNELNREVDRISKIEVETKIKLENLVFETRNYLESIGTEKVWSSDVGFQSEALKEGVHIITIENK